jgi:hypothetical protein
MKQKLFILLFLVLLVLILAGLNAVSYVQKEKMPDSESVPNRSTYNAGATGTRALFDLLNETGRKAVRWQEPPSALVTAKKNAPSVFVVIGTTKSDFTSTETEDLFKWVSAGGRFVVIDREPPQDIVTTTANWQIKFHNKELFAMVGVDPADQHQMTAEMSFAKPIQPTAVTSGINSVQQSRFASSIDFERFTDTNKTSGEGNGKGTGTVLPRPPPARLPANSEKEADQKTLKKSSGDLFGTTTPDVSLVASPSQTAPLVLIGSGSRNLVVEAPFGEGTILYVGDPYIVSNGGISLADNAHLAINLLAAGDGTIAFDEFHQGYGVDSNKFLQFFEGTPVVSIFLQVALLIGLVFFSQSRRFARPVPEPEPDRLSKLEYVSAMAELQERTRAYDLAIENVYTDFRRRAARLLGVDNYTVSYTELARLVAERAGLEQRDVSATLFKCEEIIRGEPTNRGETVELSAKLRVIEQKLGMTRAKKARV